MLMQAMVLLGTVGPCRRAGLNQYSHEGFLAFEKNIGMPNKEVRT